MERRSRARLARLVGGAGVLLLLGVLVGAYRYVAPLPYRPAIFRQAARNRLNPYLVAAVIRVESGFRPEVTSGRGAVGLMQILPGTARWINGQMGQPAGPLRLTDPDTSIRLGSWYLGYLLTRFHGRLIAALAAYNGGPQTVDRWIQDGVLDPKSPLTEQIPYAETRIFVDRVLLFQRVYQIMYGFGDLTDTGRGGGLSWPN